MGMCETVIGMVLCIHIKKQIQIKQLTRHIILKIFYVPNFVHIALLKII